jgi:hypothetical protein
MIVGPGASALQRVVAPKSDKVGLAATDEILDVVSKLRHLPIKSPVKSSAKTKDEIEQFVLRDLDENTPPEEFHALNKFLLKLGLISEGFALRDYWVKLLREQVAGFYDPKTREFYLAAWLPASDQKKVMAHELVHALQDQHFNLRRFEKWPKGDSDAEMAAHALIEGDATLLMIQYDINAQGLGIQVTRLPSLTETMLSDNTKDDSKEYPVLSAAPRVLRETLQFPYVYGAGFAQAVWKLRALDGLNRSYTELPASSEQIMHPEKFFNLDTPTKIEIPDLTPGLGSDWKRIDLDVNGEFGYQVVLSEFIEKRRAIDAAAGWGGDQYVLYENKKSGAVLLAQFTTWDTRADAVEFFNSYAQRTEKRYKLTSTGETGDRRTYSSSEGLVTIQLRDQDVIVVEGASNEEKLAHLVRLLWQSRKSPR